MLPVVVVGAGPVGLAAAIALRRSGIACRVLERHPSTLDFPKGRGVTTRSMEIFREWGIAEDISAAALPRKANEHFFLAETLLASRFRRFRPEEFGRHEPPSPVAREICAQNRVEEILLRRALELGADVRFSTRVTQVTQHGDRVLVTTADRATHEAAYVIAADGGRSAIRDGLGITTRGPGAAHSRMSILVEADLADRVADRLSTIYKVLRPARGALFAVVDNDRQWLLMLDHDPAAEPPESFTDARCRELVLEGLGDEHIPVRVLARRFYTSTTWVADRFRMGRVLLAGDAAHATTPFGGLGMNCGIADAHNLGWKLAGVLDGWARPSLLDTYDAERRPVALATSNASILSTDLRDGPPRAAFDGVTLGYSYMSAAVIPDGTEPPAVSDPVHDYVPTGRPGHRAPHVWLADGRSTVDLPGGEFLLLCGRPTPPPTTGPPLRVEVLDGWQQAFGVERDGMVLVRPDGHVAWRSADGTGDPVTALAAVTASLGEDASTSAASTGSVVDRRTYRVRP